MSKRRRLPGDQGRTRRRWAAIDQRRAQLDPAGGHDCTGRDGKVKRTYPTRDDARAAERAMKLKGRDGLRAYRCPDCGSYHVGHPPNSGGEL